MRYFRHCESEGHFKAPKKDFPGELTIFDVVGRKAEQLLLLNSLNAQIQQLLHGIGVLLEPEETDGEPG